MKNYGFQVYEFNECLNFFPHFEKQLKLMQFYYLFYIISLKLVIFDPYDTTTNVKKTK